MTKATNPNPESNDAGHGHEPTPETFDQLDALFTELEPVAQSYSVTIVETTASTDDGDTIRVTCTANQTSDPDLAKDIAPFSLFVSHQRGYEHLSFFSLLDEKDERAELMLDLAVSEVTAGMVEPQAAWLRQACEDAKNATEATMPQAVEALLEASPFPVLESKTQYVVNALGDGSKLAVDWTAANRAAVQDQPMDMPIRTIFLRDTNGMDTLYVLNRGGESHLVTVPSKRQAGDTYTSDSLNHDRFGILEEIHEGKLKGEVTEESLKRLLAAVRVGLESGAEDLPKRDPFAIPEEWGILPSTESVDGPSESKWIARIDDPTIDHETGEVWANTLLFIDDDSELDGDPESDEQVLNPDMPYDPNDFPVEIRDQIMAGAPFEVMYKVTETYNGEPIKGGYSYKLLDTPDQPNN